MNAALKHYVDADITDGFDGIIVYQNPGVARMMRMVTGKTKIEKFSMTAKGVPATREEIETAFCALLPPVTRKP